MGKETSNNSGRNAKTKEEVLAELIAAEEKLVAAEALLESQDLSLALFRESERIGHIGHWQWDQDAGRLSMCSDEYAGIMGMSVDEALEAANNAEADLAMVYPDDHDKYRAATGPDSGESNLNLDYRIVRADGEIRDVHEHSVPTSNVAGDPTGSFGILQDITELKSAERSLKHAHDNLEFMVEERTKELADTVRDLEEEITRRREVEEKLEKLANHDHLTGLPSLRLCRDRLNTAIAFSHRNNAPTALMFLDLDGFKAVNDTLGHDVGDSVLIETAQRLQDAVRETDTVARLGGDEFVIIMASMKSPDNASRVAATILESLKRPFDGVDSDSTPIGASIGIAICPQDAIQTDELLRKADEAMYEVKRTGKNSFGFSSTDVPSQNQTDRQETNPCI